MTRYLPSARDWTIDDTRQHFPKRVVTFAGGILTPVRFQGTKDKRILELESQRSATILGIVSWARKYISEMRPNAQQMTPFRNVQAQTNDVWLAASPPVLTYHVISSCSGGVEKIRQHEWGKVGQSHTDQSSPGRSGRSPVGSGCRVEWEVISVPIPDPDFSPVFGENSLPVISIF